MIHVTEFGMIISNEYTTQKSIFDKVLPYVYNNLSDKYIILFGQYTDTFSLMYASIVSFKNMIHVYEGLSRYYKRVKQNIENNNLDKIICVENKSVFCHNGVQKICGEKMFVNTLSDIVAKYESSKKVGLLHCHANPKLQNLFWFGAKETIEKNRPHIVTTECEEYKQEFPEFENENKFNLESYLENLNYSKVLLSHTPEYCLYIPQ